MFGGIPPAAGASTEEGFSEWATTVGEFPMAVRYDLTPISALAAVSDVKEEVDAAIAAYMAQNKGSKWTAVAGPGKRKSTLYSGMSIKSGEKMYSPNGRTNLMIEEDGHLVLRYDNKILWTTQRYPGKILVLRLL